MERDLIVIFIPSDVSKPKAKALIAEVIRKNSLIGVNAIYLCLQNPDVKILTTLEVDEDELENENLIKSIQTLKNLNIEKFPEFLKMLNDLDEELLTYLKPTLDKII